jgi:hypothetical protein
MKPNTKLQTPFAQQVYEFLKKHLHNFYPGSIIKTASTNKQPLKASFYHIIRSMAGERPEFLTTYIYQANPTINKQATIPFNILEQTLKMIIFKFTNIFFTKLNYIEIFASPATIPPYKPENRLQFCLNLACLHLYLSNNYQAIDYKKFATDLELRPKTYAISSYVIGTNKEEKYLTIKSDTKFNIQLLFNLPESLFKKQFSIPSLKNSLEHFEEWFENFFPSYNRQFKTPLNKDETKNLLKSQIRRQFIFQLKKLLPSVLDTFLKPLSYEDRRDECFRHLNYHILTCKHDNCPYVTDHKHNTSKLFKDLINKSYEEFPKENDTPQLQIDTEIFNKNSKHEATFTKPIPTILLDSLADNAEQEFCTNNLTLPSKKRRNGFFYQYLTAYQHKAAENLNIHNLNKDQAINNIITDIVNTDFLARVITYFDLNKTLQTSYTDTVKYYKETAYPEAEKILALKFNLKFQTPLSIEDSLFLKEPPFQ